MTYITLEGAKAWCDPTKLVPESIDGELEASVSTQVFAVLAQAYDTSSWVSSATTPSLVKKIIAMMYVAWLYQRTYSEDSDLSNYGSLLMTRADALTLGLTSGTLVLTDVIPADEAHGSPDFYPTDASSALVPTLDDPSLGPPRFTMGTIW